MLRKLALVGLVLTFGRGTIAQLSVAILLSFSFFALQMSTWPYKILQDNLLRATTEAHVFIVIVTALVLKQDLSWEAIDIGVYDIFLFATFVLFVPIAFLMAVFSKLVHVHRVLNYKTSADASADKRRLAFDLQRLGLATSVERDEIRRFIEGWYVEKKYALFLSHFKTEAAAEARVLKLELVNKLRTKPDEVFLDADNLSDLRDLLSDVAQSDAIVLLYTQGLLTRPWCLLELDTAVKNKVPIILLRIANAFAGDASQIATILDDLPAHLLKINPGAEDTLKEFNTDANAVANTIREALVNTTPLTFDPHQSSAVMQAQIQQLAQALVEHACPQNKPLLADLRPHEAEPWHTQRKFAVLIVHEQSLPEALEQAKSIKSWLLRHTSLNASQIEIQDGHERNLNDVAAEDMVDAAENTDCILVLQTANLLREPRCLATMYAAAGAGIPITPVVLLPSTAEHKPLLYNFEDARPHLEKLATSLDADASKSLAMATSKPVEIIGGVLSYLIPNIISKPLGLGVTQNEIDAQMAEVERTLRTRMAAADTNTDVKNSETHKKEDECTLIPPIARP